MFTLTGSIRKLWRIASDQNDSNAAMDIAAAEGMLPIDEHTPEDIFIIGYPKSGITWLQNLIAGVAYGVLAEYAPPRLVHLDLIPDVHQKKVYRRYSDIMFFKSHHLPRPDYRRVIYLLRDGRDAMVSYYQMLQRRKGGVDFLEMATTGRNLFPCKWHEHVQRWMKNPFTAEFVLMRFEDLKADAVSQLERLCQFAQIDRPRRHLEEVARSCSFGNLQAREKRMGRTVDKPWKQDGLFFRRGEVGSHRDEMPPEVQTAFLADAATTLREVGYSVSQT